MTDAQLTSNSLVDALKAAREKLVLYRQAHSGEYIGGTEFTALIRQIDRAIGSKANAGETLTDCSECGAKWELDHDQYCQSNRHRPGETGGGLAQKAVVVQPPVLDRKVTVCDNCECACCWQGEFMCDEAKGAGTVDRSIRELLSHAHPRESCEYWFKSPASGVLDQNGLDELRRYLEAKANAQGK